MTLQWLPLESLAPHPENSNRMAPRLVEKLKAHIERTGLYEPLVVRPLPADGNTAPRYQILNGHHRARALGQLGHTHARCDVWAVDDQEARLLLATLNRLEGRDDPSARARLVAHLTEGRTAADLARLLPEPPDAVQRLLALAKPPPAPAPPAQCGPAARPMTFFLADESYALVAEALREVGRDTPAQATSAAASQAGGRPLKRAEALERLALWYLESRSLR